MKCQTKFPISTSRRNYRASARTLTPPLPGRLTTALSASALMWRSLKRILRRFIGAEYCVAFNSGTSALHIALMLLNVGPGDEVVTTPFTFVATSWAISYVGAKPVYVDMDDATFNLDPKLLEKRHHAENQGGHAGASLRPSV